MTYREKYNELFVTADELWKTFQNSGHWDNNTTAGHDRAFANWNAASNNFIDFISQIKRDFRR